MNTNQLDRSPISRLLPAAILACTMGLLPLGRAQAQTPDYDAVGARLIKAVGAGELTPSQATAMMGALAGNHFTERMKAAFEKAHARKAHTTKSKKVSKSKKVTKNKKAVKSQSKSKAAASPEAAAKAWLTQVKRDLGDMVKAGKISKSEATKKYAAAVQAVNKKLAAGRAAAKKRPTKKVAAKKAPVRGVRSRQDAEIEKMKAHLGQLKKNLDAMVKAGRISKADANKKFQAAVKNAKKRMAASQAREKKAAEQRARRTPAARRAPVTARRIKATDRPARSGRVVELEKAKTSQESARVYRDLERRVQALRAAVNNGRISHEEARRMLAEIKKKMGDTAKEQAGRRNADARKASDARKKQIEAYRMRLTRAVESGRLSKEDAHRRMQDFIKRLTQARKVEEARRNAIQKRKRQSL